MAQNGQLDNDASFFGRESRRRSLPYFCQ